MGRSYTPGGSAGLQVNDSLPTESEGALGRNSPVGQGSTLALRSPGNGWTLRGGPRPQLPEQTGRHSCFRCLSSSLSRLSPPGRRSPVAAARSRGSPEEQPGPAQTSQEISLAVVAGSAEPDPGASSPTPPDSPGTGPQGTDPEK